MKSLYKIQEEYVKIAEHLFEEDGELTPELEQLLNINKSELEQKGVAYAYIIKDLQDYEAKAEAEIKIIQAIENITKKNIELLKSRISSAMKQFGVEKIESEFIKLSFRKSERVDIENEDLIPDEYKTYKPTVNKSDLKDAIKKGIDIQGCSISVIENLQIK